MSTEGLKKLRKVPKSINDLSKENLKKTLILKKECNARAQLIVERLIEPDVPEEFLISSLKYISTSHYNDVVEERTILKICGYPLCKENLKIIPKKQFQICTKSNKVFDITERKKFCSNDCYKASQFLKEQMLTSPLWLRNKEVIPQFKIYKSGVNNENPCSATGKEIDFGLQEIEHLKIEIDKINENKKIIQEDNCNKIIIKDHKNHPKALIENDDNKKKVENNLMQNIIEKNLNFKDTDDNIVINKQTNEKKLNKNSSCGVIFVEKCIEEWFSLESLCYLLGDAKVKELFLEKGNAINNFYEILKKNRGINWNSNYRERYLALCKRLDILELNENKYDSDDHDDEVITNSRASKPLPDYEALKEENIQLNLKVKSFYSGKSEFPVHNIEKNPFNNDKKEKKQEEEEKEEEEEIINIPLIDVHAQHALRKRIVLDRLNRIMTDLMSTFNLRAQEYCSLLSGLVTTFHLEANNIIFKLPDWNLVGLIMIKMLSFKDSKIKKILDLESSRQKITLLLMGYNQSEGYLDSLFTWLTDIDRLINKLDK